MYHVYIGGSYRTLAGIFAPHFELDVRFNQSATQSTHFTKAAVAGSFIKYLEQIFFYRTKYGRFISHFRTFFLISNAQS